MQCLIKSLYKQFYKHLTKPYKISPLPCIISKVANKSHDVMAVRCNNCHDLRIDDAKSQFVFVNPSVNCNLIRILLCRCFFNMLTLRYMNVFNIINLQIQYLCQISKFEK